MTFLTQLHSTRGWKMIELHNAPRTQGGQGQPISRLGADKAATSASQDLGARNSGISFRAKQERRRFTPGGGLEARSRAAAAVMPILTSRSASSERWPRSATWIEPSALGKVLEVLQIQASTHSLQPSGAYLTQCSATRPLIQECWEGGGGVWIRAWVQSRQVSGPHLGPDS